MLNARIWLVEEANLVLLLETLGYDSNCVTRENANSLRDSSFLKTHVKWTFVGRFRNFGVRVALGRLARVGLILGKIILVKIKNKLVNKK